MVEVDLVSHVVPGGYRSEIVEVKTRRIISAAFDRCLEKAEKKALARAL